MPITNMHFFGYRFRIRLKDEYAQCDICWAVSTGKWTWRIVPRDSLSRLNVRKKAESQEKNRRRPRGKAKPRRIWAEGNGAEGCSGRQQQPDGTEPPGYQ